MRDCTGRYLAIALALGLAAYANSLGNGFTFDDFPIVVKNPLVRTFDLSRHFSSSYWPDRPEFGLYRPLTVLSYSVNYWLGGLAPGGYHAVNLAIHLLNGALAFRIALHILGGAPAAGLVAATFLLHPVQTEAVNGVVGRAELLVAALCLLAFLFYVRATTERDRLRPGPYAASLFTALLACFAKEQGVVLIGILVAYDVMVHLRQGEPGTVLRFLGANWRRYLPYVGVVTLYLAIRVAATGSILLPERPLMVDNLLAHLPVGQRLATAVAVIGRYGRLLAFPHPLSADYSYHEIRAVQSILDLRLWGGMACVALCMFPIVQALRRRCAPEWGFGAAFFAMALLPAANLLFPIGTAMAERLLYLPCLGLCFLLGVRFRALMQQHASPWALPLAALLLAAAYGVLTHIRNPDWRDNLALFSSAAKAVPGSAKMRLNLGRELHDRGDLDGAVGSYREALKIHPDYVQAHSNLGLIYQEWGIPDRALAAYSRAIELDEDYASAWANLGILLAKNGRLDAALEAFQRVLALDPDNLKAIYNYGLACQEVGKSQEAAQAYLRVLEFEPGSVDVAINLGELYNEMGYTAETIAVYRRVLKQNPEAYRIAYNLAVLLERMGSTQEAAVAFEQAAGAKDERGDFALLKAGEIYHSLGEVTRAEKALKAFLNRWKGDQRHRRKAEQLLHRNPPVRPRR